MSTRQDDADALFGTPAPAAEAAKSPFGAKPPAAESRKDPRVKVKWAARVQIADGRVAQLRVCDISDGGIGLAGEVGIPTNSVLTCAIAVPGLTELNHVTSIVGTIRTTHTTVRGPDLIYGGTWVSLDSAARDLIRKWIRRLR